MELQKPNFYDTNVAETDKAEKTVIKLGIDLNQRSEEWNAASSQQSH